MAVEPFTTPDYNAQLARSLAKVYLGAASAGEVTALAARIADGDDASWHARWSALGKSLCERGEAAVAHGEPESARRLFLRAAEAWRQAGFFHRHDLDGAILQGAWRAHRAAFDRWLALSPLPARRLAIPFEGTHLPAILAVPAGEGPFPALLVPGGYDSTAEEMTTMVGLPAVERGYAVLAVDGPGQGASLIDPGIRLFMRPDWGPVIGAVLDAMTALAEIDGERIAAVGISFGGLLVPRGAAGEGRLAALVLDPGQYDVGAAAVERLPPPLREALWRDDRESEAAFAALEASPAGRRLFRPRMAAHGLSSARAYLRALRDFHNREAAPAIRCPTLVCDNEEDPVSTRQGRALAEAMTAAPVTFRRFTAAEGAGGHCEGTGREVFDEAAFAFLAGILRPGRD